MAVIWSEIIDDNHYEVRSAGASLRLYRNGVHHTQYNPNRPLSGSIWDLLVATALFRDPDSIDQALILGFGAGAAGRMLRELVSPTRIVGVDLDPIHLSIADGFFNCSEGCELVAADASQWVDGNAKAESKKFDWILDDLYGEDGGIPFRCGPETNAWFTKLASMLTPTGMLVVNFVDPEKMLDLPLFSNNNLRERFPYAMEFSLPAYDNRILAFSRHDFSSKTFTQNASNFYEAFPRCRGVASKYRIKRLAR